MANAEFGTEVIDEDMISSEAIGPREIILRHFDRISQFIFKGEERPTITNNGNSFTPQIDRRQILCQAIDFAVSILKPKYDEEMKEEQTAFENKIKELDLKLNNDAIKYEAYQRSRDKYKEWVTFFRQQSIIPIDKMANYYDIHMNEKYKLYMELFTQLNFLLSRNNYLASEAFGS